MERNRETVEVTRRETLLLIEERKNENEAKVREIRAETERFGEGLARINRVAEEH